MMLVLVFVTAAAIAALLTLRVRTLALRHRLLDIPNERSSHAVPTPRGGGVAIAAVVSAGALAIAFAAGDASLAYGLIAVAGVAVAAVGYVDDRRSLAPWPRLAVQAIASAAVLGGVAATGPVSVPGFDDGSFIGWLAAMLALVWLVNLFNFMDGIDGLAGGEAVFVGLGMAACVGVVAPGPHAASLLGVLVAGSAGGFLALNWPPARIFMGDVGSGFLGLMLGALGLVAHLEAGISLWVPVILLGSFVVDATTTLLRRVARAERWYEAHRTHAYQHLSRRFGSHRPVTITYLLVNVAWLLPVAIFATLRPELAWACAAAAYAPLIVAALLAGSGRPEARRSAG